MRLIILLGIVSLSASSCYFVFGYFIIYYGLSFLFYLCFCTYFYYLFLARSLNPKLKLL
jgi:hypothetical protein